MLSVSGADSSQSVAYNHQAQLALSPSVRLRLLRRLLAIGFLISPALAHAAVFESLSHGAILDANMGAAPVGDFLLGEIGGQTLGIVATHDGRFLHQWQGLLAFKAGELATTRPFTTLVGGHGHLMAESGYRFQADQAWSAYLGLRLGGDLQIMAPWGVSLSKLNTINNIDGIGDVNASGLVRLVAGSSWLDASRSLLLTAFVQGSGRVAEVNLPGAGFVDVGIAARFDLAHAWALSLETLWGTTLAKTTPALGLTDVTTHVQVEFEGRKVFRNGMWFGANVSYVSERDTWGNSTVTYNTRSAPTLGMTFLYGFPLGKQEWP